MKIAVLMSTYNGEKFIREQIESILAQEGSFDLQLWVRDDGSSDNTVQILEEYAQQGKLCWYTGENLKPAKSFLNLVDHCKGYDFYTFADQDDYWYPDKVRRGVEAIEKQEGPALYASNALLVDAERNPLGRAVYRKPVHVDHYSLTIAANVLGCTCVFNEALAQCLRSHTPDKLIMHDSYAATLCAFLGGSVVYDHVPSMEYRQHNANVVGSQWKKWAAVKDRINRIIRKREVSVSEQTSEILKGYSHQAGGEAQLHFMQKVTHYKKSFFSTFGLSVSRKPKFQSLNMAITIRLSILLRKR